MKQVSAPMELKIEKKSWEKFVRRLSQLSRRDFASLKVSTDYNSIVIQQISPVARMQRTIIIYRDDADNVVVDRVTMESADGLHLPSHQKLKEDVIHFMESFID